MTRVAALLRVSTVRQARKHREDEETLPVQREAARRFVASRPGWELAREYSEEGVSAWSNLSEEREILQTVLADARAKAFEVLVVFKYDRLSRQSLEYPMLLHNLHRVGVSVWSVADDGAGRELKVDGQMDKLLRFVEGWQAETESYNTSVRVTAKMRSMAEQGTWTGGRPPYGFRLNPERQSGGQALAIDPDEAEMVRLIFRLYSDAGLGSGRVAEHLNAEGYRLRNGKPWTDGSVRQVLRNPQMAGRPAYGRTYKDPMTRKHLHRRAGAPEIILAPAPIQELAIVPWECWEAANKRLSSYNRPGGDAEGAPVRHSRSEASGHLLTGLLECGACRGRITGGYSMPRHLCADGSVSHYRYRRYVCRSQAGGAPCAGQRSYGARKVDSAVMRAVAETLARVDSNAVFEMVRARVLQDSWQKTARLDLAKKREEQAVRLLREWTKRLNDLLAGRTSPYREEFLAERVREAEQAVTEARDQCVAVERARGDLDARSAGLEAFFREAPTFLERFEKAELREQKRLLSRLLAKIVLTSEGIVIHWRVDLDALAAAPAAGNVEWREHRPWAAEGGA